MEFAVDIVLIVLLLLIAVWIVAARQTFSAVVIFMAYGLLLSLAWVRLAAVDVALTEAAIGSGITGMLLLNAAARVRRPAVVPLRVRKGYLMAVAVLAAIISVTLGALVLYPVADPATLAPAAMARLADSGLGNPVAGVLFVYRSFDTLLEKVVLLLALVGVWSLSPDRAWGGIPGLRIFPRRDGILDLLAQTLPPIGLLAAIYTCWIGASHPGGAFQGGAILAAMWLLVMIAGLRPVPSINSQTIRIAIAAGPLVFVAIGIAGIVLAGHFLAYPAGFAKPLIVIIEVTLTLSIGITLALLAAGPPDKAAQP